MVSCICWRGGSQDWSEEGEVGICRECLVATVPLDDTGRWIGWEYGSRETRILV